MKPRSTAVPTAISRLDRSPCCASAPVRPSRCSLRLPRPPRAKVLDRLRLAPRSPPLPPRRRRGAPFSVPLRLADGRGESLHARHARFRKADRAEIRSRARPPVGGHCGRAQARSARRSSERAGCSRHLERHCRALAGGRLDEPLPIEMSGLPVFDRDRQFTGYRGFGICREVDRLSALERLQGAARTRPRPSRKSPTDNVLAVRPAAGRGDAGAQLRSSAAHFEELARELSDRLKKTAVPGDTAQASTISEPSSPRRRPPRRGTRAKIKMTPAMPARAGRFSTACRSAFWSIASTT